MSDQRSDELFRKLAAEEPPLQNDDTLSSATAPTAPVGARSGMQQQFVGGMLLIAALVFTLAAGLLTFLGDTENDENTGDPVVVAEPTTDTKPLDEDSTATPTPTVAPGEPTAQPTRADVLPTAPVDVAAVALLTPAVVAQDAIDLNAVQRSNSPFTRRIGDTGQGNVTLASYVVQTGDTLDEIKEQFQLEDVCSIIWSNDRRNVSPLRPGVALNIPPVDGYYARINAPITIAELAEASGVSPEDIIESVYNPLLVDAEPDQVLPEGAGVMVPGGDGGNCAIWSGAGPADENAPAGPGSNILDYVRFYGLLGCNISSITPGSFPVNQPYTGNFFAGFSAAHTGVDLAGNTGDPIRAAGGGTVIFAGVNNFGYGNTVVIAHGSSFTIYAHLNSIGVSCGQQVGALAVIGTLGSTGRSSGPHLHFEIRNANFEPLDPCFTIRC